MKGFVFSVELFLAMFFLAGIFSTLLYSFLEGEPGPISKLEMKRHAVDLLKVLDETGKLDTFDAGQMGTDLNIYKSKQYRMRLEIERYSFNDSNGSFDVESTIELGDELPSDGNADVLFGRRLFLTFENDAIDNFHNAMYWVWLK